MDETFSYIVGVDLSGPANVQDTVLVAFEQVSGRLRLIRTIEAARDREIWGFVSAIPGHSSVTIGLDAPLSYNPGGGDRPGDADLRRVATAAGLLPGSIMPPTLHRMIYLTVRGMAVARGAKLADGSSPRILEVHPGAAMALGGAPIEHVRRFAKDPDSRTNLLNWLEAQGMTGIFQRSPSAHYVAACAAALAAWKRSESKSAWLRNATPPDHPFDYSA